MKSLNPNRLENATNIVTICALVIISGVFVHSKYFRSHRQMTGLNLKVGNQFPRVAGLDLTSSQGTLLIAATTGCPHCLVSFPFYRRLSQMAAQGRGTRVVFLYPPGDTRFGAVLRENDLSQAARTAADFVQLGLNRTPSLILLDSGGRIEGAWVGELGPTGEGEVLQALAGRGKAAS